MATANQDDTTNCPVCFDAYEEGHIPRLLPCTHTVCEVCLTCLINRSSLTCPECRMKHPAENDVKSFPQNKYILANIRRKKIEESTEHNAGKKTNMVENYKKHGKELAFYCNEKSCQMVICPLCILQDHRSHDVVDVLQVKKNGVNTQLKLFLLLSKEKLVAVEEEMKQSYENDINEIKRQREELIRKLEEKYDKMVEDIKDRMTKLNQDIHVDISAIDQNIAEIDEVDENTNAQRIETEVKEKVSGVRIYPYYKYKKSLWREGVLDELCGRLTEKTEEVDFTRDFTIDDAPVDSPSDVSPTETPEENTAPVPLAHEIQGREYRSIALTQPSSQQTLQIRVEGEILILFKVKIVEISKVIPRQHDKDQWKNLGFVPGMCSIRLNCGRTRKLSV